MHRKALVATVATALSISSGAALADDGFTAADVLTWDQGQQDWYIYVSVGIAGVVASMNEPSKAACINRWYFAKPEQQLAANKRFKQVMKEYSGSHPNSAIVAVIQKECGSLTFSK
ncbi:MAG: hypothetical protein AAF412_00625 [Pseudomonadota bacterium]